MDDPFTTPSNSRLGGGLNYGNRFDTPSNGLGSLGHASPSQLKRALQARLEEVQKRINEAGQLGESLLRQQKVISDRLHEVEEEAANTGEVRPELRKMLVDLEKEYNEVHRESARALLSSKIHAGGIDTPLMINKVRLVRTWEREGFAPHFRLENAMMKLTSNCAQSPSTFSTLGTGSPSKMHAPVSRRQRNQPSKPPDIVFAAEVAQALIVEVRKFQSMVQERDVTIKLLQEEKANLERQAATLEYRIRALEESDTADKDQIWNMELLTQELQQQLTDKGDNEGKLHGQLVLSEQEKNYYIQVVEDLKQSHFKTNDENEATIRHHEGELATLRRSLASAESDRDTFKRTIDDLRKELEEAQKASLRLKHFHDLSVHEHEVVDVSEEERQTPDVSRPPSPTKPTPRHGPLEAETLRSSLSHAHRMITNLKNTINREKTEKAELKRLLAEARDDAEHRKEGSAPPSVKRRRDTMSDIRFKKPVKLNLLGATRKTRNEITVLDDEIDNAEWEDDATGNSPQTPQSPLTTRRPTFSHLRSDTTESFESAVEDAFETAQETDSAFETANERAYAEEPATPSKDYPTSADELTETEGPSTVGKHSFYNGFTSLRSRGLSSLAAAKALTLTGM